MRRITAEQLVYIFNHVYPEKPLNQPQLNIDFINEIAESPFKLLEEQYVYRSILDQASHLIYRLTTSNIFGEKPIKFILTVLNVFLDINRIKIVCSQEEADEFKEILITENLNEIIIKDWLVKHARIITRG